MLASAQAVRLPGDGLLVTPLPAIASCGHLGSGLPLRTSGFFAVWLTKTALAHFGHSVKRSRLHGVEQPEAVPRRARL